MHAKGGSLQQLPGSDSRFPDPWIPVSSVAGTWANEPLRLRPSCARHTDHTHRQTSPSAPDRASYTHAHRRQCPQSEMELITLIPPFPYLCFLLHKSHNKLCAVPKCSSPMSCNVSHTLRLKGALESSCCQCWASPPAHGVDGTAGRAPSGTVSFSLTGALGSLTVIMLLHVCGEELFITKHHCWTGSDHAVLWLRHEETPLITPRNHGHMEEGPWHDHGEPLKSVFTQQLEYCKQKEPPVQTES